MSSPPGLALRPLLGGQYDNTLRKRRRKRTRIYICVYLHMNKCVGRHTRARTRKRASYERAHILTQHRETRTHTHTEFAHAETDRVLCTPHDPWHSAFSISIRTVISSISSAEAMPNTLSGRKLSADTSHHQQATAIDARPSSFYAHSEHYSSNQAPTMTNLRFDICLIISIYETYGPY